MNKMMIAVVMISFGLATTAWADKAVPAPVPVPAATIPSGAQNALPVATPPVPVQPPDQVVVQSAGPLTPAAPIDPAHRSCTTDADCALVQIRCNSCCPPPSDFDAVNKQYANDEGKAGACTQEHIQSCGVPECGLFTPEPYPVASCLSGKCTMVAHAPEPRTP